MKKLWLKVKAKLSDYYFMDEGGKRRPNSKRFKYSATGLLLVTSIFQILSPEDNSGLGRSFRPFKSSENTSDTSDGGEKISKNSFSIRNQTDEDRTQSKKKPLAKSQGQGIQLVYSGKQVIESSQGAGSLTTIPSGTNFIGKLLNGIDTREPNQVIKVTLPYGARHASGGFLPPHAILLGIVSHSADTDKIFLRFNKIVFPNGREFKIDAQGLNSADFSPGLIGDQHSNSDLRVAGSMGLTLVSAASDVLTSRSMVGAMNSYGLGANVPDSNVKNAMLQGVSQVTKQEAQRNMQETQKAQEYVTLLPDSDLIVSLLSPFSGEPL